MTKKETLAKVTRVISIPPVMVSALIIIFACRKPQFFNNSAEIVLTIFLLGIVPVLAYPLQKVIPSLKDKGRDGQRKLAFVMNLIGYGIAFLWGLVAKVGTELLVIYSTYFFSVVLLTVCNKLIHYRASGHACSFTGPLILLIYFIGWKVIIPCVLFASLIIWSSLFLKRHTTKELTGGIVVCLLSFCLALLMVSLLF